MYSQVLRTTRLFGTLSKIWEGGLAIYGGIIGGFIGVFAVCRHKKKSLLRVLDCIAPGVMIGQLIGRWGNFVNAEAYGVIGPYDFLGHTFDAASLAEHNPFIMTVNGMYVHPTFLYESVWNLIGFLLINAFWKHKKYDGQILLLYLTWYGFGRAVIEGFRGDSLYIGSLRISQLLAFICFAAGVILLIAFAVKDRESKPKKRIKTNLHIQKGGKTMAVRMDGKALSAKIRGQINKKRRNLLHVPAFVRDLRSSSSVKTRRRKSMCATRERPAKKSAFTRKFMSCRRTPPKVSFWI